MKPEWVATVSYPGRYHAGVIAGALDDLRAQVEPVRAHGEGYLEVSRPGSDYPALFVGFRGERAVVHFQEVPESMYQMNGDGSVPADAEIDVVILSEVMTFPGDCAMTWDRALEIMEDFARTGSVADHPRWLM
jgi:hypothetical protein